MALFNICLLALVAAATFLTVNAYDCGDFIFAKTIDEDVNASNGLCFLLRCTVNGDLKSNGRYAPVLLFSSSARKVDVKDSGEVGIIFSEVTKGGVKVEGNKGNLEICGSTISDVIEFKDSVGDLIMGEQDLRGLVCTDNTIVNDVKVSNVTGNVTIISSVNGNGETSLINVDGNITLRDASFNKITIEKTSGEIVLRNIVAKEIVLKGNTGGITIEQSSIMKLDCQNNSPAPKCRMNNIMTSGMQCSTC